MRSLLRTRLTPGEFTHALAARLARLLPAPPYVPGPLRLALLYLDTPVMLNISAAYAAYQSTALPADALLDATTDAIRDRLDRLRDPATWKEARRTVRPWLLAPTDPDALLGVRSGGAGDTGDTATVGDLSVAYRFTRPVVGTDAYVTPAVWGVTPEAIHAAALANLRAGGVRVGFVPISPVALTASISDRPEMFRLAPRDRDAATRLLLPEVRAAILRRIGGPAAVLPAARAAVFVAPVNPFGEPPAALSAFAAHHVAHAGADALTATPFVIADDSLVFR